MALRLEPGENFVYSCAVQVDKGKVAGVQMRDVRISIAGKDLAPIRHTPRHRLESGKVLQYAAAAFKSFFDGWTPETEGILEFQDRILEELNEKFHRNELVTYKRFVVSSRPEPSVEALMGVIPPQKSNLN